MSKNVAVIGGGPAGLMAAGKAGQRGLNTTIFEKQAIMQKALITGKGRCNITNNTDIKGLIDNIRETEDSLYSSFSFFFQYGYC